jgi:hypothetical protein
VLNASRTTLIVVALAAVVLLVLGLATDVGIFGWIGAIILGAWVVAAWTMGRRSAA